MLARQLWLYLDVAHLQKLTTWLLTTNFAIGDHLAITTHVKKVTTGLFVSAWVKCQVGPPDDLKCIAILL